jgi:hypothetical protein
MVIGTPALMFTAAFSDPTQWHSPPVWAVNNPAWVKAPWLLHLTLLAPDVVEAVLDGRRAFDARAVRADTSFPDAWAEQARSLAARGHPGD